MTSLIKFELGKILRNRTVFGGIVVGCLVLLGIFFVGYHYSQLSMSEPESIGGSSHTSPFAAMLLRGKTYPANPSGMMRPNPSGILATSPSFNTQS